MNVSVILPLARIESGKRYIDSPGFQDFKSINEILEMNGPDNEHTVSILHGDAYCSPTVRKTNKCKCYFDSKMFFFYALLSSQAHFFLYVRIGIVNC